MNKTRSTKSMKRITLNAPPTARPEEKAAWVIYPDFATGTESHQHIHPQAHNRERIIRLASGGYGAVDSLSRPLKKEIKQFCDILDSMVVR